MGVQLGNIVKARKLSVEELQGRIVAFDGNNILYQFLSIIRGRDGQPLKDREGRITSHLSGLIYRNSNLMEQGVKIVYVFDGTPHKFKRTVLKRRQETRQKAKKQYEKAIEEGDEKGAAVLDRVGLGDRLHHRPSELSGGQQQRVAVARAMANDPQVILADEPTGNLDSVATGEIISVFQRLNKDGITVIIVTHEMDIAEQTRRIIRLHDGKVASDEKVA